ncbi:Oxidoreductase, N-terminal [Penicillium digitatum]|uniref:Uncharacterized protein n=3 Tax=Penicillium digitatum TaxID=36651 RepID=K9GD14_PEND2|nr:hypothetical protein PDIP_06520 [Penicillium digitatum Pd1]EKV12718.1 hypothetical protein PDIG_41540 [Penicillium digitatum PHI26]EKV21443.1 hypothetical protein PDIP_06520 [Penicillium digitatum Pd1]KAG0155422.1 hypothetical protein PDIDSM_999 [Penicillium digitatum]QQK46661.1 Oxidoreductase, N-terminal [Penicillium digitatum]
MPNLSGYQELDIPSATDERWDADDEDSGSERTLNAFDFAPLSIVLGSKHEARRLFRFTVRREEDKFLVASGKSDGWIDASHFLWTMCATLADAGTDRKWSATFEKWRPQWEKVQTQVKTFGYTQFSSEIPPAPVDLALVQFFGSRVDQVTREFEIEQEGPDRVSDGQDIWTLWRYITETPADQIREFHVTLRDTARLVGSQ